MPQIPAIPISRESTQITRYGVIKPGFIGAVIEAGRSYFISKPTEFNLLFDNISTTDKDSLESFFDTNWAASIQHEGLDGISYNSTFNKTGLNIRPVENGLWNVNYLLVGYPQ